MTMTQDHLGGQGGHVGMIKDCPTCLKSDKPFTVGLSTESGSVLGRFKTEYQASKFIETLSHHEDGRYYLDGPEEANMPKIEGIPQEWVGLGLNTTRTSVPSTRFGLLSYANKKDYDKGHVVCLACRSYFPRMKTARSHECRAEEKFRMFTKREVPVGKKKSKRAIPAIQEHPTLNAGGIKEFIQAIEGVLDERDALQDKLGELATLQEQVHLLTGENIRLTNQVQEMTEQTGGITNLMGRLFGGKN